MKHFGTLCGLALILGTLLAAGRAGAQPVPPTGTGPTAPQPSATSTLPQEKAVLVGVFVIVQGTVKVIRAGIEVVIAAGDAAVEGDTITTGKGAGAQVHFLDTTAVRIGENTELKVVQKEISRRGSKTLLHLSKGAAAVRIIRKLSKESYFYVSTPVAVAGVRGTEIALFYDPQTGALRIGLIEGQCVVAIGNLLNVGVETVSRLFAEGILESLVQGEELGQGIQDLTDNVPSPFAALAAIFRTVEFVDIDEAVLIRSMDNILVILEIEHPEVADALRDGRSLQDAVGDSEGLDFDAGPDSGTPIGEGAAPGQAAGGAPDSSGASTVDTAVGGGDIGGNDDDTEDIGTEYDDGSDVIASGN